MLIAIMLATAAPVATTRTSANWQYYGSGGKSCGKWTEADKTKGTDQAALVGWVAGFVSGVNHIKGRDILARTDMAGAFAWIDNYCAKFPLKDVAEAAEALAAEVNGL